MSQFIQSYTHALLTLLGDQEDNSDLQLGAGSAEKIKEQCEAFMSEAGEVLTNLYSTASYTEEQAGIDFYLTRNGHGAGFWDRGLGACGMHLTVLCEKYGSSNEYVGDDGLVYL